MRAALTSAGRPVMDPGSSTYVATFGGKDALARLVEAEYLRRGGEHFRQVVALGDGAAWIWTMAGALDPPRHPHSGYLPRTRALRPVPEARHVHRLGRHRRRHQGDRRPAHQAVRHALDRRRCRGHHLPALPALSSCAASTPAAGGTSSGQPAAPCQPRYARSSERQQDSDSKMTALSKIIPNKAVVHPRGPVTGKNVGSRR
jgi:hypothetical protein